MAPMTMTGPIAAGPHATHGGGAMAARLARPFALIGSLAAVGAAVAAFALRIIDPVPLLPGEFGSLGQHWSDSSCSA